MQDVEIIGMLKTYVKASLIGMGALKGASCQIQSIVDGADDHTITFKWEDDNGDSHTSTLIVKDGATGATGATGAQGPQGETGNGIASIEKTGTSGLVDTYTITMTDGTTSTFTVTNGSGGSSGDLSDLNDVTITNIADGQTLAWDAANSMWVNVTPLNSVSVNGVQQTITNGAVGLDVASNLITEAQWTQIGNILT